MEYRYVNRREASWTYQSEGFYEKPAFWLISPYQAYLLFPVFIVVALAPSVSAWAGNMFLIATVEDIAYFLFRGAWVRSGEWTTRLFGSFSVGGKVVPVWWPLALAITAALYLMPL
ncbi:MAG: hypothetical protein LYZ66_05865 [Nitrososphaerales archaeon]|nr:hypothetical protein [Nitrososphaerales archaeon]